MLSLRSCIKRCRILVSCVAGRGEEVGGFLKLSALALSPFLTKRQKMHFICFFRFSEASVGSSPPLTVCQEALKMEPV